MIDEPLGQLEMSDLERDYGVPAELMEFIDDGFLEVLVEEPAEKTVELHAPSLRRTDPQGRITAYSITWIHPDYNSQFCHYYENVPGDFPNFYVTEETSDVGNHILDVNTLDDLIVWLADSRSQI
ncbi:MAG TPA: hypothetical protein VHV55_22300 [Pirellulales bacterium]|nr:hypothetical protein [Pirellulales bacterium]